MRLTAAITNEGEWHVARCLEVEVASQGITMNEALANQHETLELYFEDAPNIEPFQLLRQWKSWLINHESGIT